MKKIITLMSLSLIVAAACYAGSVDTVEHVAVVEIPSASATVPVPAISQKPLVQMAIRFSWRAFACRVRLSMIRCKVSVRARV